MAHASPHSLAANDVTVETYYNGHQSILMGHCSKTHFEMTFDLELYNYGLQSPASYGHKNIKVGQLVQKQSGNKRTDGQDRLHYLPC